MGFVGDANGGRRRRVTEFVTGREGSLNAPLPPSRSASSRLGVERGELLTDGCLNLEVAMTMGDKSMPDQTRRVTAQLSAVPARPYRAAHSITHLPEG
jgi:hypothetical protein